MANIDSTMSNGAVVIERAANGIIVRPHMQFWDRDRDRWTDCGEIKVFNSFADFTRWFEQFFPVLDVMPAGPEAPADQWTPEEMAKIIRRARTQWGVVDEG